MQICLSGNIRPGLAGIVALMHTLPAAGDAGFHPEPLRPAGEVADSLDLWSANVPPHLAWNVGFGLDVAYSAIRLGVPELNLPERDVVSWRGDARLTGVMGLFGVAALGIEIPWVMFQIGLETKYAREVVGHEEISENRLGDLGLLGEYRLWGPRGLVPAVSGGVRLRLPTGQSQGLNGEPGIVLEPLVAATYNSGPHALSANLGYRARTQAMQLRDTRIGDQLVWSLGGHYSFAIPPWQQPQVVLGELSGLFPVRGQEGPESTAALEARLAIIQGFMIDNVESVNLTLGVGFGLLRNIGTPLLRGFLTIGFSSEHPSVDEDRDGIPNRLDACVAVAEDYDGFEDTDGCVELDNDQDGFEDMDDDCPDEAEDPDEIDDWDGCPDPDALDDDRDGFYGESDECPDKAEDFDSFEDFDGCPEPDNDGDQLADLNDLCPNAAEDLNGFEDDDGCPDHGRTARLFSVKDNRVRLHRPILFGRFDSRITARSFAVIDQLAAELRRHSEISKVRIIVYPKRRSRRWRALARARHQAIRWELLKRGVERHRVATTVESWSKAKAGDVEIHLVREAWGRKRIREAAPPKKRTGTKKRKRKRRRR